MPTYGYRCSRGHQFEVLQRITDVPLETCPQCGAPATRVFYPVGVIFKGQGFYKTDSRDSSTIEPGKSDDSKTNASKTKAAEKPTPKPEKPTKAEGKTGT